MVYTICIFSSNEDIIQLIRDGDHDDIGAEKLRGLLKILPELDELEMLRAFDGDKTKLGNAEKFLLQLIDIPKWDILSLYHAHVTFDVFFFALKPQ